MEEIIVKQEEPDTNFELEDSKDSSWRSYPQNEQIQQQQQQQTLQSRQSNQPLLPYDNPSSGPKPVAATHISSSSSSYHAAQRPQRPVQGQSTNKPGRKNTSSTNSAYSLGQRCGELFVAKNARQWTFVCTFCNKSTRDIGDFICHIKMKHLSGAGGPRYENDYYENKDYNNIHDDYEETCIQEQDVRNYFRHNRRAIEIIPINQDNTKSSFIMNSSVSAGQKRFERTSSEYFDCGNYLDINVHTEPEELNYSKCEKAGSRLEKPQKNLVSEKSSENSWKTPKQRLQEQQPDQHSQLKQQQSNQSLQPHKKRNSVQDDSENDVEDVLDQRKQAKESHSANERPHFANSILVDAANKRNSEGIKRNVRDTDDEHSQSYGNDDMLENSLMDHDEKYNGIGGGEDDFDNQLLLQPTDSIESTTPGSDVKVKRRQIRGTAYCALCNKTFQYYSLYRNHMIKHSNETPFKCNLCKKGFKSKQAIRYHMNTHQKDKQFKCQICDAGFYTENQFITHILTHENDTTFPCMVCGKVLRSDKDRDAHLSTHTEERPFRCDFCNKLFRLRHHLSNHLKMHRQYRCDYCKEEFTSAVHLRKPYACSVCENSPDFRSGTENEQMSISLPINPMQLFEAITPPTKPTECVDIAEMVSESESEDCEDEDDDNDDEDDDMNEPSSSRHMNESSSREMKPFPCKQCPRSYSHLSGLNFHLRNKHS